MIRRFAQDAGADIERMTIVAESQRVTDIITANRALASELQLTGTPSFVFGDRLLRGYLPLADMQSLTTDMRERM